MSKTKVDPVLSELYNEVERKLSYILQPHVWDSVTGQREILDLVREARDNLRRVMLKMCWKGEF